MKWINCGLALVLSSSLAGCGPKPDAGTQTGANAVDTAAPSSASVPPLVVPDSFMTTAGMRVFDGRRAADLTGDGVPETVVVHATGSNVDSADVALMILSTNGDTLFRDGWNTRFYFQYEYRSTFSDSAANAKIVAHLRRLLSDSSFTTDGAPARLVRNGGDGVDRDAVLYDLKEQAVRDRHAVPAGTPLRGTMLEELEAVRVPADSVEAVAAELKGRPTFTYHAGGEVTYTIAWSDIRRRFIRIFSCC